MVPAQLDMRPMTQIISMKVEDFEPVRNLSDMGTASDNSN
jgi:hypothetical protein